MVALVANQRDLKLTLTLIACVADGHAHESYPE
jgi:hypothetical protein